MTIWFSDATEAHTPPAHCLVCWGYGRIIVRHQDRT